MEPNTAGKGVCGGGGGGGGYNINIVVHGAREGEVKFGLGGGKSQDAPSSVHCMRE